MTRIKHPPLPVLGPLEEAVLEHLWHIGEGEVIDIHQAVVRSTHANINTIGSALERLHRKGLLSRTKISHAYRYKPAVARDEFLARRMVESAGGTKNLISRGLLTSFLDLVTQADARALDELEELIVQKRRERRS